MTKKYVWASSIFFILLFFFPSCLGGTIHVGDKTEQYSSIQQAIRDANPQDSIKVHSGIYTEPIDLYKSVQLIGESNTILEYNGSDDIISISADNCLVSGFIIQNGRNKSFSGINIESDGNIIQNNTIQNNEGNGIYIYHASSNVIKNNTLYNNNINIVGSRSDWTSTVISHNSANGFPLLFYKNQQNITIDNVKAGQIIFANCNYSTINHSVVTNGNQGITLGYSDFNHISNNTLSQNQHGLRLQYSMNNTVTNNVFEQNSYGLFITHSFDNEVIQNNMIKNTEYGCYICCNSNRNILTRNNFTLNNKSAYDIFDNIWHVHGIGNYWSDYSGEDTNNDGIGDTPYDILPFYADSNDSYPIVDYAKIQCETSLSSSQESPSITLIMMCISLILLVYLKKKR